MSERPYKIIKDDPELTDYLNKLEAELAKAREEPTRERPHIEVLLAENGKLHSELRQVKREAKADSKRLDKLDSLAKFHGPRVNFYRTGPHMDGGTVVLQIMGQREVEGVDLRDAIDGWEEPHE